MAGAISQSGRLTPPPWGVGDDDLLGEWKTSFEASQAVAEIASDLFPHSGLHTLSSSLSNAQDTLDFLTSDTPVTDLLLNSASQAALAVVFPGYVIAGSNLAHTLLSPHLDHLESHVSQQLGALPAGAPIPDHLDAEMEALAFGRLITCVPVVTSAVLKWVKTNVQSLDPVIAELEQRQTAAWAEIAKHPNDLPPAFVIENLEHQGVILNLLKGVNIFAKTADAIAGEAKDIGAFVMANAYQSSMRAFEQEIEADAIVDQGAVAVGRHARAFGAAGIRHAYEAGMRASEQEVEEDLLFNESMAAFVRGAEDCLGIAADRLAQLRSQLDKTSEEFNEDLYNKCKQLWNEGVNLGAYIKQNFVSRSSSLKSETGENLIPEEALKQLFPERRESQGPSSQRRGPQEEQRPSDEGVSHDESLSPLGKRAFPEDTPERGDEPSRGSFKPAPKRAHIDVLSHDFSRFTQGAIDEFKLSVKREFDNLPGYTASVLVSTVATGVGGSWHDIDRVALENIKGVSLQVAKKVAYDSLKGGIKQVAPSLEKHMPNAQTVLFGASILSKLYHSHHPRDIARGIIDGGLNFAASSIGAAAGQALIPFPVVGAAIGRTAGSELYIWFRGGAGEVQVKRLTLNGRTVFIKDSPSRWILEHTVEIEILGVAKTYSEETGEVVWDDAPWTQELTGKKFIRRANRISDGEESARAKANQDLIRFLVQHDRAMLDEINAAVRSCQHEELIQACRLFCEAAPEHPSIDEVKRKAFMSHMQRGLALHEDQRLDEAKACFLQAQEWALDEAHSKFAFERWKWCMLDHSELALKGNDITSAAALIEEILAQSPNDSDAHAQYALLHQQQQNLPLAVDHYNIAMEHAEDPSQELNLYHAWKACLIFLGQRSTQQMKFEEAAEYFQRITRRNEKDLEANFALGNLSMCSRDYAGAERYFRQAESVAPNDPKLLISIAAYYSANHDTVNAAHYEARYKEAIKPFLSRSLTDAIMGMTKIKELLQKSEPSEEEQKTIDAYFERTDTPESLSSATFLSQKAAEIYLGFKAFDDAVGAAAARVTGPVSKRLSSITRQIDLYASGPTEGLAQRVGAVGLKGVSGALSGLSSTFEHAHETIAGSLTEHVVTYLLSDRTEENPVWKISTRVGEAVKQRGISNIKVGAAASALNHFIPSDYSRYTAPSIGYLLSAYDLYQAYQRTQTTDEAIDVFGEYLTSFAVSMVINGTFTYFGLPFLGSVVNGVAQPLARTAFHKAREWIYPPAPEYAEGVAGGVPGTAFGFAPQFMAMATALDDEEFFG